MPAPPIPTGAQLRAMVADPRYWNRFDPGREAYVAQVTRAFQRAYPAEAGSGGTTTVRAHTRLVDGKPVQVAEHQRAVRSGAAEALPAQAAAAGEELAQAAGQPNAGRNVNAAGRDIIISSEGDSPATRRLHHPGGERSGVTLGFGYDMGQRTRGEVMRDLMAIGVNRRVAYAVSGAAGQRGAAAARFVAANRDLLVLSNQQRTALFARVLPTYESLVSRLTQVNLNDNQFSALVSFAYNTGAGGFARSDVLRLVNAGDFAGAAARLRTERSDNRTGVLERRAREVERFTRPVQ